jgi:hypothetical protein
VASQILAEAGIRYVSEYPYLAGGYVYLHAGKQSALPVGGYEWMLNVSAQDTAFTLAGADSVRVRFDTTSGIARVRVGRDSLAFDVGRLSSTLAETSDVRRYEVPAERLRLEAAIPGRRGALMLESIEGRRTGNTLRVTGWRGTLFLGR